MSTVQGAGSPGKMKTGLVLLALATGVASYFIVRALLVSSRPKPERLPQQTAGADIASQPGASPSEAGPIVAVREFFGGDETSRASVEELLQYVPRTPEGLQLAAVLSVSEQFGSPAANQIFTSGFRALESTAEPSFLAIEQTLSALPPNIHPEHRATAYVVLRALRVPPQRKLALLRMEIENHAKPRSPPTSPERGEVADIPIEAFRAALDIMLDAGLSGEMSSFLQDITGATADQELVAQLKIEYEDAKEQAALAALRQRGRQEPAK